jgi:hypothetical protein
MRLFVTTGKIRKVLEDSGPQFCSQEFGSSARKHLSELSVSKQESPAMRKAAVEALVLVGIDKITIFDLLKDLPEDLKDVFYNLAFSATANKETKESIIFAAAANDSPQLREEVRDRILSSPDPDLTVLIEENLKKENLKNENDGEVLAGGIRANYADMLASKQGSAASQTFISVLKTADPRFQVGLVDRLVHHLTKWNISGPEYEDLLIEQLYKLQITQWGGESWSFNNDKCF